MLKQDERLIPLTFEEILANCGKIDKDTYDVVYGKGFKIYNKKFGGPLICGNDINEKNQNDVVIDYRRNFEDEGKEIWYIINTGKTSNDKIEFKLLNKKSGGPLFPNENAYNSGDQKLWVDKDIKYEKLGKERWFLLGIDYIQEFKIINKKYDCPIMAGELKDKDGRYRGWMEGRFNFEDNGKERWYIHFA